MAYLIDWLIDWLVFNANFSNIPAISWHGIFDTELKVYCRKSRHIILLLYIVTEISGGPLVDKYQLEQFHFHWGSDSKRGSEHTLNGYTFSSEVWYH